MFPSLCNHRTICFRLFYTLLDTLDTLFLIYLLRGLHNTIFLLHRLMNRLVCLVWWCIVLFLRLDSVLGGVLIIILQSYLYITLRSILYQISFSPTYPLRTYMGHPLLSLPSSNTSSMLPALYISPSELSRLISSYMIVSISFLVPHRIVYDKSYFLLFLINLLHNLTCYRVFFLKTLQCLMWDYLVCRSSYNLFVNSFLIYLCLVLCLVCVYIVWFLFISAHFWLGWLFSD